MSKSLRRRAEERLAEEQRVLPPVAEGDLLRLVHELRVHQIELEMQNEELRFLKDAAEAASRAKSAFFANISHEVRTPLSVIVSLADVLAQTVGPDAADLIARINLAGRHLLAVIDDILDLAKLEAGRLILVETEFDPQEVVDGVRDLLAAPAAAKALRLQTDTSGLPERLLGDPVRLRQALLNYAGNALKFTTEGSIILRAECIKNEPSRVWLRFSVRDTGTGIDAATQERLFRPFEQGSAPPGNGHNGTGLGLHLVARLAGLMAGSVGVDSSPGMGSLFWFTARLRKLPDAGAKRKKK
ncbi:MAG: hypothetical protein JNJ60_03840 [Rhodocyclaceae bacterium]|nr:hypothetical protein [Rhodocyclaceae bacterium]